ncbi:MAG: polysaccharide biosynthesis tyrosine autokinase [Rubrivivax sp.]|nr:polysaccharide biosynthesis tyrosine autokinase [Pyrinomonadaceae bacterium]
MNEHDDDVSMSGHEERKELAAGLPDWGRLAVPIPPHTGTYYGESDESEGAHLRDYWRAVRKRLWLVVGVVVLVTLLAAIYMGRQPDVFVAQTRVQVDLEIAGASVGAAKNQSVIINNPVNDPTYFNTQLQILTSPGLLRRVAKTLDLEHNAAFRNTQTGGGRSTWRSLMKTIGVGDPAAPLTAPKDELPLTSSVAPAVSREDLAEARRLAPYVNALQAGLRVEPVKETRTAGYVKDTRLIDITFRHQDPQVAAKIVNAIADTFVLANLEKKTETNTSTGDFLQRRVAELQSQIRSGEEQLANYAKNNQIITLDNEQNIVAERLTGLNRQLLEAENERKLAEASYRAASEPRAAGAIADSTSKAVDDARSKLDELRQKRSKLATRYTDEYPEVVEVDTQIAELEKQLKENRGRATNTALTNLETRYRQTLAREESLRAALSRQRGETVTQNDAGINYRIIQQEIATNRNLLDGLLQRSRENDVVLAGTPNNISVVDYALAPDYPVGPRRTQGVMLAFLLSLAFGAGLSLFLEYLNDTVRSSEDVETLLHLPALSVIPTAGGTVGRLLPGARALQRRRHQIPTGDERPELLLNVDQRSPLAEAYRHLRTSVLLSRAGQAPRTLLVSSSLPSEGKTTTSINTAISLAQTGARVVVVDADMRRPCLHKIFDQPNGQGLSTILSSEMTREEMLAAVRFHEPSGLHLLGAGPVSPNPAELLGSEQMRNLIAALSSKFTHVIIDSPPIVSFTDGVLISTMVEGVLLVVRGGKTPRSVVRRSRQVLSEVGAKVLGVVLNNVTLQRDDYYYYRYYHSYYETKPDGGVAAEA